MLPSSHTGENRTDADSSNGRQRQPRPAQFRLFFTFLLLLLLTTACDSVRPVAKVGLIAPFEGLHRRSGYEALDAVRLALEAAPAGDADLLPLALDNSHDPERTDRAAAKLAADPAVAAVIGPLSPAMTAALPPDFAARFPLHIAPYAVDPTGGFVDPARDDRWATELLRAVGAAARTLGADRLVLAGPQAGWPALSPAAWSAAIDMPVAFLMEDTLPQPGDAVFWRGDAAEGAAALNALHAADSPAQFWLGPAGGDPVFVERARTFTHVYWATWTDLEYNRWKIDRSPASPQAYLLYRATEAAADQLSGQATSSPPWQVALYAVDDTGVSVPLSAE